ncbi:MAG: type II toxin-antitoxin system VapC family toxin [Candidatus Methanoperedens sp.]|nr:type II toxin-antitoxin system VapC family toxin [Candidatus Methanoperedens sp.]
MTVLDTNFLIDLLKDKPGTSEIADSIEHPKTTTINAFELYYGANSSARPEENISKINYLLKSIVVLEFDKNAALKAGNIQAKLMKLGKPIDPYDVLIAGIVMANNEEIMTRDINHFNRIPGLRFRSW